MTTIPRELFTERAPPPASGRVAGTGDGAGAAGGDEEPLGAREDAAACEGAAAAAVAAGPGFAAAAGVGEEPLGAGAGAGAHEVATWVVDTGAELASGAGVPWHATSSATTTIASDTAIRGELGGKTSLQRKDG